MCSLTTKLMSILLLKKLFQGWQFLCFIPVISSNEDATNLRVKRQKIEAGQQTTEKNCPEI